MKELLHQVKTTIDQKLCEQMTMAKNYPLAPHIKEAMEHSLFAGVQNGGSRRRPALSHITAMMLGNKNDILRPCVGMELLHTYSLILDDMQDNDAIRHGVPAVHVKFGKDTANMAANCLFGRGMVILSETIPDIIERVDFMHAGQDADIRSNEWENALQTDESFRFISNGKTGGLFAVAMRIGATGMGRDDTELQALEQFGVDLGYLYQIGDDYKETTRTTAELGKPGGADRGNKLTFMKLHSPAEARDIIVTEGAKLQESLRGIADICKCDPKYLVALSQHVVNDAIAP